MTRSKRMLVTGATGVVGSALIKWMKDNHPEVEVIALSTMPFSLQRLHDAIKDQHITYFVNAAGIGGDKDCEERPWECFEANTSGVINQLEVIRRYSPDTRWIGFGTAYESTHQTPYSATKRAMREAVETYRKTYGLYAVIATLGFTESCGRKSSFLSRKITSGVARIAKAIKAGETFEPLTLKDIDERFSFTWAEDVADGVWSMLNQEAFDSRAGDPRFDHLPPNDYSLISSETASLREFVTLAFKEVDIPLCSMTDEGTEELYTRIVPIPEDWVVLVRANGDCKSSPTVDVCATTDLGWQPQVSFPELVKRMMACEMEAQS